MAKAKRIWADRQLETCKGTWNLVKELRGKTNALLHDHSSNREELDNLLSSVTNLFQSNFNDQADAELHDIIDEPWHPVFSLFDVKKELISLNERKSAGSDSIDAKLLRIGAPWLASPLHDIFQCSIRNIRIPSRWKLADIVPIPKCNAPSSNDYRPISLLPAVAKILERLILKSLKVQLLHLYGPQQHAFRPLGSTSSALIQMHDRVTRLLDQTDVLAVRVVCLDFSKAFDKIHHNRLINYLHDNGISGGFLLWLQDCLTGRQMRVKINGHFGPMLEVRSGVPQGSVLGPYLFAAFMGSLTVAVDADMVLYADDVSLIETIRHNSVPNKLSAIDMWVTKNRFVLNYAKTKQLIFTRSTRRGNFHYPNIELVNELKILGVHWNNKLTWERHFEKVMRLCSQRLYVIRVLKSVLTKSTLIRVYHSLITSLLLYAAPLFSWLPATVDNKLEKFQKRSHRIICGWSCACADFPPLRSVRESRAFLYLPKCEAFKEHPLHHIVPNCLPRSGDFCLPVSLTSRRLHSFIP